MSDIARCNYKECPQVENCKRFMENAEQYQNYKIDFNKICLGTNNYQYLIPKETKPVEQNQEENKNN